MMSKKQLACMLALHIMYLLVGASIFYHIESPLEVRQRAKDKHERLEIQNLLYENYIPDDPEKQDMILRKLSDYCDKSMFNYTTEDAEPPFKWDFYHSFFFSYTVVSTIGYGNLAPTTHLSRILMIFYALFGIPINGILLANLGEYFGLQLISVYRKYKRRNAKRANRMGYIFTNLGMLGQIFLYLVPGFLFFIFLPSCIFVVFEGWDYVASIYYAFVTLTTIGFGDLVAGTVNNDFKSGYFFTYQIFLIIWITFGLGYIVMLLGFITSGMRSEKVHRIEQKFASQFKNTQNRILQGFTRDLSAIRKIINEANIIKIKPIYVEPVLQICRSQSCPNFTFDSEPRCPVFKRKRANSENIQLSAKDMLRIQSDTDLLGIDKEKTFNASALVRPAELLARVVKVLGDLDHPQQDKGVNLFDDEHILANERQPRFSIGPEHIITNSYLPKRSRAQSVAVPNYKIEYVTNKGDHDFTWTNGESGEKFRREANLRSGKISLPSKIVPEDTPPNLFSRLFNQKHNTEDNPAEYLKNTMKGRVSNSQASSENVTSRPRRGSIFPSFGFGSDPDKGDAESYKEKTKRGRHSIFPTFHFNSENSDEEDAAIRAYKQKTKRHSIFPTFDFSEDDDDSGAKAYRERTKSGRRSIFPTFDFSDPDDDSEKYKESTKRGRRSIFPTFNFSGLTDNNDDDTTDQDEIQKYQNRTKKGRLSLFPTFGKSKKNVDGEVLPESSDELVDYKTKTQQGRKSLFPSFGKNRKGSSPNESTSGGDIEASIKQYRDQINRGRNSYIEGDLQNYRHATEGGRGSSTSVDMENYRNRTRQGRPSLFDPDVNITGLPESEQIEVLENTSVADLLRALAVLETANESGGNIEEPPGLMDLITNSMPNQRRGSIRPDFSIPSRESIDEASGPRRRRVSARAAAPQFMPTLATVVAGSELQITAQAARENRMSMLSQPPPPYSEMPIEEEQKPRVRRYSPAPQIPDSSRSSTPPVSRLFSRIRKESIPNTEESDSRRSSLTDVVIDNMKDNT